MSKVAGIEGKLHAKHTGRAITLGVCEPTFRAGWSVGGCLCARCGKIGIVNEQKVCRRCVYGDSLTVIDRNAEPPLELGIFP